MNAPANQADKTRIAIVGGGRTGSAIADLLRQDGRYDPYVLDIDYDCLRRLSEAGIAGAHLSGTDTAPLTAVLRKSGAVICAAPPAVAAPVARAANAAGCPYVDMCEDMVENRKVLAEATSPDVWFAPGAGLAPGLLACLVDEIIREGQPSAEICAYVGVLPAEKTNRLGYGNLWGVDGLVAEYTVPTVALEGGKIVPREPMGSLESVVVDGEPFEAFSTSGNLETLVHHSEGQVRGLELKTLRYPGHHDYIRFLLDDLRLSERPYMFRNLLLNGLEPVDRDRVILHIVDRDPSGPRQMTRIIEAEAADGAATQSAVASVTAQHACAVMDILVTGLAPRKGVLHHTDLPLAVLAQSPFGRVFGDWVQR